MSRYLVGFGFALGLVLLLGAADDASDLANRVRRIERLVDNNTAQVSRANSRLDVLEARVAALEKKLGGGSTAAASTPPGDRPAPEPLDAPTTAPAAEPADIDPLAAYIAEQDRKKVILNLRTAGYNEVDGLEGLWVSPIEQNEMVGRKVQAVGKLRYIGGEDLSEYGLTLQIMYRNRSGRMIGMAEFDIEGKVLKPDRDHVFRQITQLAEEYSILGSVTFKYLKKAKLPPEGQRYRY